MSKAYILLSSTFASLCPVLDYPTGRLSMKKRKEHFGENTMGTSVFFEDYLS